MKILKESIDFNPNRKNTVCDWNNSYNNVDCCNINFISYLLITRHELFMIILFYFMIMILRSCLHRDIRR